MSTRKAGLSRPRMSGGRVHVPRKESESILAMDDVDTKGRAESDYIESQPEPAEKSDAGERKNSKQKVDWDNIGAGFKKAGKVIKDTVSAGMKGASDAASAYGDWYEKKGDKNRERSLRQAKARVEYESQYEPLRDELLESRESRLEDQAKLQELEYREEKEQIRRESAQRKLDLERQEQDIEYQEREYKQQERLARLEDRRLRAMGVAPQPRQQNRMPQSRPQNGGFRPVQNNMRAQQQQQQPQRRMGSMDFMNMSMGNQNRGQPVSRQNQNINPPRRMNSLDFIGSVSGVMGMQNTSQSQPQPQFQQPMAQNPPRSSRNRPHPLPPAPVSGSRRTSKKSRGRARHDDYDDYEEDYGDDYDDYDGYEDDYDNDDDSGAVRRVARKRKPARRAPPKKKSPPKRKPAKKTSPRKKPVRRASSTRR